MANFQVLSESEVRAAENYLSSSCDVMAGLVAQHSPFPSGGITEEPFRLLVGSIVGQSLSVKAADTIEARLLKLCPKITPRTISKLSQSDLTDLGLSRAKGRAILALAERAHAGILNFDDLAMRSDDEIIAALTECWGIGRWTAEMFLIFGLRRPNVLSIGDSGLRRASAILYGSDRKITDVAQAWSPYCSVASWYLWRHLDEILK